MCRSQVVLAAFVLALFGPVVLNAEKLPSLSVSDVTVSQEACGGAEAVFTVTLSQIRGKTVTVHYATADGTAIAGADYSAAGTLTFSKRPNNTPQGVLPPLTRSVTVPVTEVLVPGPDKTFSLLLSGATNATVKDGEGVATIQAPQVAKCQSCGLSCDDASACTSDSCSATRGCQNVNVSACATPICSLDGTCGADSDADGLSDAWESNGYVDLNCNGANDGPEVDVELPGADPSRPDIYVRYDYMVAGDHDHQPPQAALDQVVAAFALQGVALHFVAPAAGIPEHLVTTLDPAPTTACAGTDFVTMAELRAANFGNLAPAYHYMVFAHRASTPDSTHALACPVDPLCFVLPKVGATGLADLPGDDVIVSFGNYIDTGTPLEAFLVATTTMHELGHNLGLKHGGADACVISKPNYISVMNPDTYQLNGIPVADAAGSTNFRACSAEADCEPPNVATGACATPNACHCTTGQAAVLGFDYCYRVDYSGYNLLALNELSPSPGLGGLDENVGVGGPSTDEDIVFYFVPGPSQQIGASNGSPIDWNGDGVIQTHVTADINNDSSPTFLTTQNDWERSGGKFLHLNFQFQCASGAGSAAGASASGCAGWGNSGGGAPARTSFRLNESPQAALELDEHILDPQLIVGSSGDPARLTLQSVPVLGIPRLALSFGLRPPRRTPASVMLARNMGVSSPSSRSCPRTAWPGTGGPRPAPPGYCRWC